MWKELVAEYGMFLAKLGTASFLILALVGIVIVFIMRAKSGVDEHLEVKSLNQKYEHMQLLLQSSILSKKAMKKAAKELKTKHKEQEKQDEDSEDRRRIFVLDFDGDIRASEVSSLREEITAINTIVRNEDEVLVILESGGGTVHGYGLAASQLKRFKEKGIKLTVAVDKVAASGGYMMACVADKIIAAPFAIIGSIGVLAQIPNFHRLLKKHDIDFEQISAGKYKRTLTLFGENKDEDREKLQEELEETHVLFKKFVKDNRQQVDIENIATGEHWYGSQAIDLGLVDKLQTSDDYLAESIENADIYQISYVRKKPFLEKLFSSSVRLFDNLS